MRLCSKQMKMRVELHGKKLLIFTARQLNKLYVYFYLLSIDPPLWYAELLNSKNSFFAIMAKIHDLDLGVFLILSLFHGTYISWYIIRTFCAKIIGFETALVLIKCLKQIK